MYLLEGLEALSRQQHIIITVTINPYIVLCASHDSKSFTYINQFITSCVNFFIKLKGVGVKTKQKPSWVLSRFVH